MKKVRLLATILCLGLFLAACGLAWFFGLVRASLPRLDGSLRLPGLSAPVAVERDALGVPTITGANRNDVARALGYLHAQDRFFQMDLSRRRAAGELSELFGAAALPLDRAVRLHRFRALARRALAEAAPAERGAVEAYAAGVNSGLADLGARPFEYYVLRAKPRTWLPEDSVLMIHAMALALKDGDARYELSLSTLRDTLGMRAVAFFAPVALPSDAALDGSTGTLSPVPPPAVVDLRKKPAVAWRAATSPAESPGSNSFAVSGRHTASGAALLENDMHLGLSVPNTWYRASLRAGAERLDGITLPGLPFLVAGSNGRVAWALTKAYADTSDLVAVSPTASAELYHGPGRGQVLEVEKRRDQIAIRGSRPVPVEEDWTIWGPVLARDAQDRPLALRWVLDDPGAVNLAFSGLEGVATVGEAVAVAHRAGVPALNFLAADAGGHIAWTIAGFLPRRVGYDGRLPASWIFGDRRWDGLARPEEIPVVDDSSHSFLWTANSRMTGGRDFAVLGDGGYEGPARAAQVRDDLGKLVGDPTARVRPADLLAVALDERALFLSRWRDLLLQTLSPEAVAGNKAWARMRAAVEDWGGRAAAGSAGYRLVRLFRGAVVDRTLGPIFAACREADPGFDWSRFHYDDAVWTLVHDRPLHLLAPEYPGWDDLLLAAADDVGAGLRREGLAPEEATWGRYNTLRMRHPFSQVMPAWLTGWLNMPADPLPGDSNLPRVQTPDFGASERFVVSPGREAEGIMEMPGGQSGHPLSPFYRAGHQAWVKGDPTPFLPGPAVHRLVLAP